MTEKEQAAREAELARREAALAAREAQLEQEQAKLEAARAEAPKGRKTLLNNNDPDFVNPKEKLYDKFPLTVHQMDIIIGVLFALIVLFLVLGMTIPAFSGCSAAELPPSPGCTCNNKRRKKPFARQKWRRAFAVAGSVYSRTYLRMKRMVRTYIRGLIFFSLALPVTTLMMVQEMTPMAMPSEML